MMIRRLTSLAAVAALAVGVAACGDDEQDSGAPAAKSKPEPVAQIDQLTGQVTAVKLDAGFVEALGALKVTPGVIGSAKLENGSLKFPITGGNVTYYKHGSVNPYVQGRIEHEQSGFSLTAGGKKDELENLVVDAGK